jgi:uncharacterized membrane protein YeaQ/YmgE (transglycosylase-associated protein family)
MQAQPEGYFVRVSLILYLLLAALSGLVIGALARLLVPGPDPMTILETILVGISGTMIAAVVAYYVLDNDRGPGFLLSVLFAVVIVLIVRKVRQRRVQEGPAGLPGDRP